MKVHACKNNFKTWCGRSTSKGDIIVSNDMAAITCKKCLVNLNKALSIFFTNTSLSSTSTSTACVTTTKPPINLTVRVWFKYRTTYYMGGGMHYTFGLPFVMYSGDTYRYKNYEGRILFVTNDQKELDSVIKEGLGTAALVEILIADEWCEVKTPIKER